ncbi:hypothetical protein [Photobacterium piscicola]|uniref:hypothetical protein n=1 Tax=Photobacterium piscicola TaxID=1378299 RepID=UPI0037364C88
MFILMCITSSFVSASNLDDATKRAVYRHAAEQRVIFNHCYSNPDVREREFPIIKNESRFYQTFAMITLEKQQDWLLRLLKKTGTKGYEKGYVAKEAIGKMNASLLLSKSFLVQGGYMAIAAKMILDLNKKELMADGSSWIRCDAATNIAKEMEERATKIYL